MISFLVSILVIIVGYFVMSRVCERIFGIDTNRPTPSKTMAGRCGFRSFAAMENFPDPVLEHRRIRAYFRCCRWCQVGIGSFPLDCARSIFAGRMHNYFSGILSLKHNSSSNMPVLSSIFFSSD